MQTIDLESSLQQIKEAAANPLGETRVVPEIEVGQFARQGDIYIVRMDKPPTGLQATKNRQLAPGTTQGSRHTVDESVEVLVRETPLERRATDRGLGFEGPVLVSKDRFTVSHPEHADISLPGGCYEVVYQSDFASQQRARD